MWEVKARGWQALLSLITSLRRLPSLSREEDQYTEVPERDQPRVVGRFYCCQTVKKYCHKYMHTHLTPSHGLTTARPHRRQHARSVDCIKSTKTTFPTCVAKEAEFHYRDEKLQTIKKHLGGYTKQLNDKKFGQYLVEMF